MIRVAAVGDIHLDAKGAGSLRPHLENLSDRADVLLIAGDLTRRGTREEAEVVADELGDVGLPVIAVLGNHDHHSDDVPGVRGALEGAGIRVLDGDTEVIDVDGCSVGVAGVKGFGVGFAGASAADFGEPIARAYFGHARDEAGRLQDALEALDGEVDCRVALLHYAPVPETLTGEPPGIWAFLGSYLLGEAVDRGGADLAVHGHAHRGQEKGTTPGGIPVRNVALPVIRSAYYVYRVGDGRRAG